MGRGAQVRRLSGAAAGARGRIPMLSEAAQTPETGHEKRADMPNQHLGWNSVTRRPLAPPRPDWPVRRGLLSNPSATATRGRRPSSPRPTLRRISARIVIVITRPPRRPTRCALPARLLLTWRSPRRVGAKGAVAASGQYYRSSVRGRRAAPRGPAPSRWVVTSPARLTPTHAQSCAHQPRLQQAVSYLIPQVLLQQRMDETV